MNKQKFLTIKNVFLITAAILLTSGFFVATPALADNKITTISVTNLSPANVIRVQAKVPLITFTVKSSDTSEHLKSVKVQYSGTNKADVSKVYLFRESGVSGGTFDASTDIEMASDTTPSADGEFVLDPTNFAMSQNVNYQFYIITNISNTATIGDTVDVKILENKMKFDSGDWPNDTDEPLFNPSGSSLIIPPTATLTVTKIVMNDNGGTKVVSNFPLFIDGMSVTSGVASTTSQGLHTISETNQSGYAGTIGGDCAANGTITLVAGNSYNCTITNDDQPGTLIVKKILINDNGGTVATSSFSFQVNGDNPVAFEQDGQNDLIVNAGTYSITETVAIGYSTTYNNCADIIITSGGSATCTITNNDEPAKLTIIKNTTGDDGTFNFMVTNNNSTVVAEPIITTHDGTGQAIPTEMLALNLTAGHYTVSEASKTGWDLNSASCELQDNNGGGNFITNTALPASSADFTADIGESWTCTFTNTKQGSITVHKNVVAPDGATDVSDSHNFTIHRDNSETGDTVSETVTKIYGNLAPGTYTITEDIDSNYSFVSFSQDTNNNLAGAQVVVTAGQNTDITITNEQKPAHLTVIKHVNNPNGGKAVAADFIMDVNGTKFPGNDTEGITVTVTVNPGIFSVSETGPIGYSRYSADGKCSGNLASNETASCTITNSDIQLGNGAITIIKQVINDNGGTATADAFKIRVEDENEEGVENSPSNGSETGTLYILEAGASYTISEDDPTAQGYAQTGISCQPIIGGEPLTGKTVTIDLADQQAYICTITNNDIAPQLTLVKQIDNGQGIGTSTPSQWTLSAQGPTDISGASGSDTVTNANVNIGIYTLSESGGPKGYTQGSWNCEGVKNNGDSITLGLGQAATCTITNTAQPAVLTIVKKTDQVSGNGAFNFKITGTGDSEFSRSLSLQTDGGIATSSDIELPAGDFNVNEVDLAEGWRLAEVACVYDNRSIGQAIAGGERITVGNGDHITCTFTNTRTVITGEESIIKTSTTAGDMIIDIPAATTVTGPINWNGIIIPPTATTTFAAPTPDSGFDSATPVIAIEVGAGDTPLTFDKAVKITFTGQAGKYVGWSRGGIFTKITTVCDSPTNPTLAPGADCKIDIGGDLVVWTKHFTVFVAYTQTATPPAASASVASTGGAVALSPSNAYANWLAQQPAAPAPAAATPQVLGVKIFADGSLIKFGKKVYVIMNGKRTVIKNLWELAKYKGQKINVVDAETLNQYPEVLGDKAYPDNTIIKSGDKLYIIKNGQKQYIKNLKELKAYIKLYKITKLY